MSGKQRRFRQSDVTRALKGVLAAGMEVKTTVIDPDGTIRLGTENESERKPDGYEEWKANNG